MNHGRWRVTHIYAAGITMIEVYRLIDAFEVDHSGNREYRPEEFQTDEEAQAFADMLNAGKLPQ